VTIPRSTLTNHGFHLACAWALALLLFVPSVNLAVLASPAPAARDAKHDESYALIFTTVWGPDDHPVYGVKVKVRRSQDKKAKWELYSDHHGEVAFRVPAGKADYVVWADLKGFKTPNGKRLGPGTEVTVHIENDERADIGLHLTE